MLTIIMNIAQPLGTPNTVVDELDGDEELMVDNTKKEKIPRPPNAWILYRKARLDDVPRAEDGSRMPMAEASKILSYWWKNETQEARTLWELEAERLKLEHKLKYPEYRFQPKSKTQKLREKAAKKEAARRAQLVRQKSKPRTSTPPQPYATSNATSYWAAAMQAQEATRYPHPISVFSADGPSPPISQAGTPHPTPSPFTTSDFEQGSSSTSATSLTLPSPGSALGLALPSPLSFSGQEEASSMVPSRGPSRLPPRPRGKKLRAEASDMSVDTTSSAVTVRPNTPAANTPSALSPLPWPTSGSDAPQPQGLPQSRDVSPPSAASTSTDQFPEPWNHPNLYYPSLPDGLSSELVRSISRVRDKKG